MKTARTFQQILDLLALDFINSRIVSVHEMIRESFTVRNYIIDDYEEFKEEVQRYYHHHLTNWMKVDLCVEIFGVPGHSSSASMSKVSDLMGGHSKGFKDSLRGTNGGMLGVINQIADSFKKNAVRDYVNSVLKNCINPADYYKKVEFMEQYLKLYGVLLPGEEHMTAYELASNIEEVINHHVALVNAFRKIVQ